MAETAEELSDYSEAALVLFSLASAAPAPSHNGGHISPNGTNQSSKNHGSPEQRSYNSAQYVCHECGTHCRNSIQYNSHLRWCNSQKYSGESESEEDDLVDIEAKAESSEEENAQMEDECPHCFKTFSSGHATERHIKRCKRNPNGSAHHASKKTFNEISPVSNSGVPSAAPTMPMLKLGEAAEPVREEKRRPCPSCRSPVFPSELEEHLRACLEDPPLSADDESYVCPQCQDVFANPFQATQHVRACWFNKALPPTSSSRRTTGRGRNLLSCACGATFSTERAHSAHISFCPRAGSGSSFDSNFDERPEDDYDLDDADKIYSCRRCGKRYPTSQSLAGHARHCVLKPMRSKKKIREERAAPVVPVAPARVAPPSPAKASSGGGRGKYSCANCFKKFTTSQSVAGHARHCNLKKHPKKKKVSTPTKILAPGIVKRGPGRPPKSSYITI